MAEKKPTYYELLQHPKWQRKRLELLEASRFQCSECGSDEKTLHIHHAYYERGVKPWEYPDESLRVLCVDCHAKAQDWMQLLHRQIGQLDSAQLEAFVGFSFGLKASESLESMSKPIEVLSYEFAVGLAFAFGTNADFIVHHLRERVTDGSSIVNALRDYQNSKDRREDVDG